MKFLPFHDARTLVHKLQLKSSKDWIEYCKSGKKPSEIPYSPDRTYKQEWKGIGDWLGTGIIANRNRTYLPFKEARKFVRSLELKSQSQWRRYAKSGKKPTNIPYNPDTHYRKDWKNWGDWLGTGKVADQYKEFLRFEDARSFVQNLKLVSQQDWRKYCRSGKKPSVIPANPGEVYKDKWEGFGDWLGTGRIADRNKIYRSFEEARNFVRKLKLVVVSGFYVEYMK